MARVIISEYAAKSLLTGGAYQGVSVSSEQELAELSLGEGRYVVKADNGTKKRGKQGLVKLDLTREEAVVAARDLLRSTASRILIEPFYLYDKAAERYISLELTRAGVRVITNNQGGVDVESTETVATTVVSHQDFKTRSFYSLPTDVTKVVEGLADFINETGAVFVEVNPYVDIGGDILCVDFAVEIDSHYINRLPTWVHDHVQQNKVGHEAEAAVAKLDDESSATFSLTMFDKDAAIFTLLSGGGASLVTIDELVSVGLQKDIANYGEYSGAPTTDETARYTDALIKALLSSRAPKKALVIAGGVANFTDIHITFQGITDSFTKHLSVLQDQNLQVFVRRGGPNQTIALSRLEHFLAEHDISHQVHGPAKSFSFVADQVKEYLS
tara:strand:- start:1748 stop:2905 length:1158 start_codon:yes stop_codon:yes gene_type:complete